MFSRYLPLLLTAAMFGAAHAAPAPFDLAGPVLDIKVTRGTSTLPVSEIPNLAEGDLLWIKAKLPPTQSAQYLMVLAFLSGSTNPPPDSWFFACKTWTGKCAHDGMTVTVPPGAEQVLVFLAPHTGGDFRTLVSAVRGRPGAFVRTTQDLNQAALDRSRLDHYLSTIRNLNDADPSKLAGVAPILARSLAIRVDEKCLDRTRELQAPCLMQGQESLILNDGHSASIVDALTSGPGSDLAMQASYTPQLNSGYYSPYFASVLDIARIMESFRTAQYQYIPALATQQGDTLALALNTAPSFHNPMSVLVVALPAVGKPQMPPLHAVDPKQIYCARRTALILPVDGAPLVFSTRYAHDLTLRLTGQDRSTIDLPASADAAQGGFVIDTSALRAASLGDGVQASLQGYWGFDPYQGPSFRLMNTRVMNWGLAAGDEAALIVGRQDTIHVQAESVSCVDGIMLQDPAGKELKVEWKSTKPTEIEVKLPLQEAAPGAMTLLFTQYGAGESQSLVIHTFSEAGHLDGFAIHSGDAQGLLKGSRLDEVAGLSMKGIVFVPGELSTQRGMDELRMVAQDAEAVVALKPEHSVAAKVTLKDGRVYPVSAVVDTPRPAVALIGKSVQPSLSGAKSNIQLTDPAELPLDATLVFSLRTRWPAAFARDESLDIATADESSITTLNLANGGITLENSQVAVATFNPLKAFGASTFGPLQFRVSLKGVAGDWQPLANLVRLPGIDDLKCPPSPDLACKLSGTNLFLIDSIANDREFSHPLIVPNGFLGAALPVPRPADGSLYVKLRDDPAVVNRTTLAAQEMPPSADDIARAAVQPAP